MSGRFDYIQYDSQAQTLQGAFKDECEALEALIESTLVPGRAKALALTKLEEVYMWLGKAVRDEQVTKRAAQLQEERGEPHNNS